MAAATDPLKERINLLVMGEAQGKLKPEHQAELDKYRKEGMVKAPGAPKAGPDKSPQLDALTKQLLEVDRQLKANFVGEGDRGWRESLPLNPTNQTFDAAAAGLSEQALGAFRVPGVGSQSDAELRAFVEANRPGSGEFDQVNEQRLNNIRIRLDEARKAAGLPSVDWEKGVVNEVPIDATLATGATKREDSKELSSLASMLVKSGQSDEQINAALVGAGAAPLTPESLKEARDFYKANPNGGDVQGVVKESAIASPWMNNFLQSPIGTAIAQGTNAAGFGLLQAAVGDKGFEALADKNPTSSALGQIAGTIGATGGLGFLGRQTLGRVAPSLLEGGAKGALARGVLTDGAYGAAYGASTEGDPVTGAAEATAGSLLGRGVGAGLGKVLNPTVLPIVQKLRDAGIPLTVGQIARANPGKISQTIAGLEDSVANTGAIKALVDPRRAEGMRAYNLAELSGLGKPSGATVTEVGDKGVQQLADAKTAAYSRLDPVRVQYDDVADNELDAIRSKAALLPNDDNASSSVIAALKNRIDAAIGPNNEMTGRGFQEAYRGLARSGRERATKAYGHETSGLMREGQDALAGILERQAPGAFNDFLAANAANRNLNVAAQAVGAGKANDGIFTPFQMMQARAASDTKLGGKISAALRRLEPEATLTSDAQAILPNKVPPTGVNLAPVLGAAGLGLQGVGQSDDGTLGKVAQLASLPLLLSLPYTKVGAKVAEKALLDRPEVVRKLGAQMSKHGSLLGSAIAGLAVK